MDWARAIERNRDALAAILSGLFAMLGLAARQLHRAVLRVLRPAESAMRRLIVIAARGLVVKPLPARPMPAGGVVGKGGASRPVFQLFDPRKRFAHQRRSGKRGNPRILTFWGDPHLVPLWSTPQPIFKPVTPPDDGQIDAWRLWRRLEALKLALADIPRQARRLVRMRMKRETVPSLRLKSPMRPGRAPGSRQKPDHDVDHVLAECHALARDAMALDTS
jgi:hypothetical protein